MDGGEHEYDPGVFVYPEEKAPGTDAVAPGLGFEAPYFPYMGADARCAAVLRVDIFAQFGDDARLSAPGDRFEVLEELI